ncbi:MAG: heavy metal translocating P-type ATPase [Alphaproteobacteria bacterium]
MLSGIDENNTAPAVEQPDNGTPENDDADNAQESAVLCVANMNCGGCMRKVERALEAAPGVTSTRAHLTAKRVAISFDASKTNVEDLISTLDQAGYNAAPLVASENADDDKLDKFFLTCLGVAGFAAMNIMLFSVSVWSGSGDSMSNETRSLFHWLSAIIAFPAIIYAGQPFFHSAWRALRVFHLNMDVPISLAILLATGMSLFQTIIGTDKVYFDAATMLLFFLLFGRFLDQRMRTRAKGAAQNLLKMRAQSAMVVQPDGSTHRLDAEALMPGMRIAVASGERFPADGTVASGNSEADESLLTGESLPRAITPGAEVFAGTVNLGAAVEFTATKTEGDTVLAELSRLMESAEQARGRYVRLADRAANLYAPAVHLLALATFIGWLLLGVSWESALETAIAVLIITCPCALALAVPAVQVAASSRLFANGVLVKAPDGLERLAEVDTIVFDKTGTLTHGKPAVLNADTFNTEILQSAAGLALASRHPNAAAIVKIAKDRLGADALQRTEGVSETPGAGLMAVSEAGEERLGSAEWCGITDETHASTASLWYTRPGLEPVSFQLADTLRSDAVETLKTLQDAGYSVELLSGDRADAVEPVARELGISNWRAGCKPQDKIERLSELKAAGRKTLMVGDGLNDAPALAAAHASLSPSSAADISQIASDAIFQSERMHAVIDLLATAQKAQRMAFSNFALAGMYNAVFVPIAAAGMVTPFIAAIAMSSSSIFVTANALRLRGMKLRLRVRKNTGQHQPTNQNGQHKGFQAAQ